MLSTTSGSRDAMAFVVALRLSCSYPWPYQMLLAAIGSGLSAHQVRVIVGIEPWKRGRPHKPDA